MSKQEAVNCSKQDLLRLVNGTNDRRVSVELERLIEIEEEADRALKDYEESNEKLLKLRDNLRKAERTRYRRQDQERKVREKQARECRNAIYLEGATEKTVAMVRALLEKYQS